MRNKDGVIRFSNEVTNVVASLNAQWLKEGRLATNPNILHFHSYDSSIISDDPTKCGPPDDSISRFTIDGLRSIFPLIKIELGEYDEIIVEGEIIQDFTAFFDVKNKRERHNCHIEYIKEIMLDIFSMYKDDETKIPRKMYKWYFKEDIKDSFSK